MHFRLPLTIKPRTISVLVGHAFSFGLHPASGFHRKGMMGDIFQAQPSGFFLEAFDVHKEDSPGMNRKNRTRLQ